MIIDIKIKNYYLKFIYDSKADIIKYKSEIEKIKELKKELIEFLENNINYLKKEFNIDLNKFEEWITKCYSNDEKLHKLSLRLSLNEDYEHINRTVILQLYKFTNIIKKEHQYYRAIELANKRSELKFSDYKKYLSDYYLTVQKCALEGFGYEFQNGIGIFCISRYNTGTTENILDFNETKKNKKRLLDAGIKIFNKEDADYYKSKGIPYDGVDYRVFKPIGYYYDINIIKSRILGKLVDYNRSEYVNANFRGMSYKEIADKYCENLEDIYKLKLDIKYKLNILLYKYPTKYLNFIRNANENKYKRRTYNC